MNTTGPTIDLWRMMKHFHQVCYLLDVMQSNLEWCEKSVAMGPVKDIVTNSIKGHFEVELQ